MRLDAPRIEHAALYDRLFAEPAVVAAIGAVDAAGTLAGDLEHWTLNGWGPWVVSDDEGGFCGRGGLHRTALGGHPSAEILFALVPEAWGHGAATEIALRAVERARKLGLPDVVGVALPANAASVRVLEKAGLAYEQTVEHAGQAHWLGRLDLAPPRP